MGYNRTQGHFWSRKTVDPETNCWNWTGCLWSAGYGRVRYVGEVLMAHRLAAFFLEMVDNPSAPLDKKGGGFILHTCDNRKCINPEHLLVGSYTDNNRDAYAKGRMPQNGFKRTGQPVLTQTVLLEIPREKTAMGHTHLSPQGWKDRRRSERASREGAVHEEEPRKI